MEKIKTNLPASALNNLSKALDAYGENARDFACIESISYSDDGSVWLELSNQVSVVAKRRRGDIYFSINHNCVDFFTENFEAALLLQEQLKKAGE